MLAGGRVGAGARHEPVELSGDAAGTAMDVRLHTLGGWGQQAGTWEPVCHPAQVQSDVARGTRLWPLAFRGCFGTTWERPRLVMK